MTSSVFFAFSRGAALTLCLLISLVRPAAGSGAEDWSAAQSGPEVPLATLFPIPGGTWTRSEGPTFCGYAPAEGPAAAYTATDAELGGAWMSLSLSGPGILRFVAEPCFSGVPVDSTLFVEVNGTVLREVESDVPWQDGLTFQSSRAVILPAGLHTVIWRTQPPAQGEPGVSYRIKEVSFGAAPEFMPAINTESGVLLAAEREPLEILAGTNGPVLRLRPGPESIYTDNTSPQSLLTWRAAVLGKLRFRWRPVPGAGPWPQDAAALLEGINLTGPPGLPVPWQAPDHLRLEKPLLPNGSDWKEEEMLLPFAQSIFSWRLSRTTGGIELSSLRFVPFEFVPLSTAAGVAGLSLTTSGVHPWTGLRPVASPADGMLVPYPWPDSFRPAPVSWMEAVVTGPAEIGWQQDYRRGFMPSELLIDGVPAPFLNPPTGAGEVYITVPSGTHTVRWVAEGGDSEAVARRLRVCRVFAGRPCLRSISTGVRGSPLRPRLRRIGTLMV